MNRQIHGSRLVWLGVLLLLGCAESDSPAQAVEAPDWVLGDAAEAGLDLDALDQLTADIVAGAFPNTHAVLVEYDGRLVYE